MALGREMLQYSVSTGTNSDYIVLIGSPAGVPITGVELRGACLVSRLRRFPSSKMLCC